MFDGVLGPPASKPEINFVRAYTDWAMENGECEMDP
jgi:hypothetical protein